MEVDVQTLRDTALQVVTDVVRDQKLEEFSQGTFRTKVTEAMSLPPGTLDTPQYKSLVWKIAKDYVANVQQQEGEQNEEDTNYEKNRTPASSENKKSTKPRKSTSTTVTPAGKKALPKKATKGKKPARSASVIPSSDDEADAKQAETKSKLKEAESRPKKKRTTAGKRVQSDSEQSDAAKPPLTKRPKTASPILDKEEAAQPSTSSAENKTGKAKQNVVEDGEKSESEMSVLVDDEPPARKRKKKSESQGASHGEKGTKTRKRKEPTKVELSKDEETIKRLKSLVVACGVRKVWSKEFKDLDKPPDQIRRLRQILTDLGMTGRMSMEQAKAIKEKREFEKELEDVQDFAQKMESAERRRGQKHAAAQEEILDDSDVGTAPKRRVTARQSIMAFLGDEDESD